jgi:hypothetical protein
MVSNRKKKEEEERKSGKIFHNSERFRLRDTRNRKTILKLNSVALVRERTMPTERPPLVGEVVPTSADRGR